MTEWNNQLTEYQDQPNAESTQHLLKYFARTLSDRVTAIFPKALGVKYVTAPALRRQVWNAVLAVTDIQDIPQFRQKLLTQSNRQLLQDAYSTVPNGYRLALRKTGPYAQSREFYGHLHNHLTNNPTDYRFLNGFEQVDERLLHIVIKLPGTLSSFKYAKFFGSPRDVERFLGAYILLNHSEHETPKIWTDAAQQFDLGCSAQRIIQSKFNQARFPAPVVTHPHLKHIATVGDLLKVGKRFNNCLADYTSCALQGDLQFYEYLCEENPCIVSIKNDGPYGYVQCDIKGLRNSEPDFITEVSIKRLLNDQGVMDRPRVTRLIKYAGQIRPYKPSKTQAPDNTDDDHIGLEELMMFDEDEHPF